MILMGAGRCIGGSDRIVGCRWAEMIAVACTYKSLSCPDDQTHCTYSWICMDIFENVLNHIWTIPQLI